MVTLSAFQRRLLNGEQGVDVTLDSQQVRWLDGQTHAGENIGESPTHVIFVELKEPAPERVEPTLGPR